VHYRFGADAPHPSLKWKPPRENSIDFKLELRFPPSAKDEHAPDYTRKPEFVLMTNMGRNYDFFDTMVVTDKEWGE
jgi:mRNA guanylyltransferase